MANEGFDNDWQLLVELALTSLPIDPPDEIYSPVVTLSVAQAVPAPWQEARENGGTPAILAQAAATIAYSGRHHETDSEHSEDLLGIFPTLYPVPAHHWTPELARIQARDPSFLPVSPPVRPPPSVTTASSISQIVPRIVNLTLEPHAPRKK